MLTPLGQAPLPNGGPEASLIIAMRRLTWAPGAALTIANTPIAWIVLIEDGALSITDDASPSEPTDHVRNATLVRGEVATLPMGAAFTARNRGTVPVTAV